MDLQSKHIRPEALDRLLKQYLLEREPQGLQGESILEPPMESILSSAPVVTPAPEKEAAMINRLKEQFPKGSVPSSPTDPLGGEASSIWTSGLRFAALGVAVLSVGITALILITNPFAGNQGEQIDPISGISPQDMIKNGADNASTLPDNHTTFELPAVNSPEGDVNNPVAMPDPGRQSKGPGIYKRIRNNNPGLPTAIDLLIPSRLDNVVPGTSPLDENAIKPEKANLFPLKDLFAQTTVESQLKQIASQKGQLIRGKNGTLILIPPDCFVDKYGNPAGENINLEIKEIYSPSDYLRSNLPTLTGELQLISGGIISVEATGPNGKLSIAPGKEVYVEFSPENGADVRDMHLAHGEFDARGNINWEPADEKATRMISIPLENLYFNFLDCEDHNDARWNELIDKLLTYNPGYENTWVYTREFRQRMVAAFKFDHMTEIVETYLANTDKDLWHADLIVAEMLNDYIGPNPSLFVKDALREEFQGFAAQRLTKAEKYQTFGLNLDAADAHQQLMKKGLKEDEADRILRAHLLRQNYISEMNKVFEGLNPGYRQIREGTPIIGIADAAAPKPGFIIQKEGWTHLNKFMNRSKVDRQGVTVKVDLEGDLPITKANAYLVYSDDHSLVPGNPGPGNNVKFKKVPSAREAWIVAIGYDNDTPYLGMKKIKLFGDSNHTLTLQRVDVATFKKELKKLD